MVSVQSRPLLELVPCCQACANFSVPGLVLKYIRQVRRGNHQVPLSMRNMTPLPKNYQDCHFQTTSLIWIKPYLWGDQRNGFSIKCRYKLMSHTLLWDQWSLTYDQPSPQDLFRAKEVSLGVKLLSPGHCTCDLLRPEYCTSSWGFGFLWQTLLQFIFLDYFSSIMAQYFIIGRWTYNGTFKFWWSPETTTNYTSAADCMIDFYKNQTLGPYLVRGENKTVKSVKTLIIIYRVSNKPPSTSTLTATSNVILKTTPSELQ